MKKQKRKIPSAMMAALFSTVLLGCSYPKNFTTNFYHANEGRIIKLKEDFTQLYNIKPFSVLFEDKNFKHLGLEILTDSIKYIYHFRVGDGALTDTLYRYGFDTTAMLSLIGNLQKMQCTWITKLNYYENYAEKHLVQMAIRNKALNSAFRGESYCMMVFFSGPQPIDHDGRFLDRADRKRRRMINDYELHSINRCVGYAITKHYR